MPQESILKILLTFIKLPFVFKGTYYCPIEIIKGLTDKGQFQYLTKFKGASSGELPVYNTISFTKIKINILS